MPDVFVAPDELKDTIVTHKRVPLPSAPLPLIPQPIQPVPTHAVTTETIVPMLAGIEKKPQQNQDIPVQPKRQQSNRDTQDASGEPSIPIFTSFWQNPKGIYFDTQEVNENIILFLRRAFITNIPWIVYSILLCFIPPIMNIAFLITNYTPAFLPPPMMQSVTCIYYLFVLTHAFLRFIDWYYNISLITEKRIMDIELKDLVYKQISATKISLVQDVTYQQSGTIRSLFNYGDVLIQTAGTEDNFHVNSVPKPEVVVGVVEDLIGKEADENDAAV